MNELLTGLLEDLHAAIYAYGVLGARLGDRTRPLAQAAYDAHRVERDAVSALLRSVGAEVAGPLPAYDVTAPTTAAALILAVRVEEGLAVRWRDLVVEPSSRAVAVQGLRDAAVRAAQWRRLAKAAPVTVSFPGQV